MRCWLLLFVIVFAPSCTETQPPVVTEDPAPSSWEALSRDGNYLVRVTTDPAPIPFNEPFVVDVAVFAADAPDVLLDEAIVTVDGWMPNHGHGMNRFPKVELLDDGRQRARGMLFHMLGLWELHVDVIHNNLSSRATFEITL